MHRDSDLTTLDPGSDAPSQPSLGASEEVREQDLFAFLEASRDGFDSSRYRQLLGAANRFKEGDQAQGVAAADEGARRHAQALLARTRIGALLEHPIFEDSLSAYISSAVDRRILGELEGWSLGGLKDFLLTSQEEEIHAIMPGLPSDIVGCVVKLMSNEELISVGAKVFNPLPGSKIGARGYLGARIQPNSPTDDLDDIRMQVFDGWSYAVGDVLLGTNPVSSETESVLAIERALADVVETFGLEGVLPHCVLAHIDVQAEAEARAPGSTALWFQSLAGVDDANTTFDISVAKMRRHAGTRTGKFGFYFETGQGADATNGHGKGFDMVIHEARKYGFARALTLEVAEAQRAAGQPVAPWVHVNDVAGFIGPEIFRTREQLVRCCLEDIVMGKLHGLTLGLDICSTLHMDVDLDDLDWCIERIMPACPAYLMALPTKNDPMLSYISTGFQDHVRVREQLGYRVDDTLWAFFQELGVIDAEGRPTEHFGQPTWVYLQYRRRKGDPRPDGEILDEARAKVDEIRSRGVFLAEGHGERPWDLHPELEERLRTLYADSKACLWAELPEDFESSLPGTIALSTHATQRHRYISDPRAGEVLDTEAEAELDRLRLERAGDDEVQLVISDGLNALALTDEGHLGPYLDSLRTELEDAGLRLASEPIVLRGGRVRAGYHIGERLFGSSAEPSSRRSILHLIGERPGSGHHAFSVYITAAPVSTWARPGAVDHNITRVVSGIADTALDPRLAARATVKILMDRLGVLF
ncbi:MAG: ethanolamine ammonia-lyase subunit EutB [Holophagales bacterium]|nr:ethanolamine ammonia-lyase subunit EutB [Holophagales bacterium]